MAGNIEGWKVQKNQMCSHEAFHISFILYFICICPAQYTLWMFLAALLLTS